jgi:hypothetical protein
MDDHPGLVWVTFTSDFQTRDKSVSYRRGAQCLVDPSTASALMLAGLAMKEPASGLGRTR